MIGAWAAVFGLTLAVEAPIVVAWFRREEPRAARRLAFALFATTATHPLVWFAFPRLPLGYVASVELAELFAWLVEAALFVLAFRGTASRALVGSLLANAASLLATFALRALTGWI
jgi:hypothetical protein